MQILSKTFNPLTPNSGIMCGNVTPISIKIRSKRFNPLNANPEFRIADGVRPTLFMAHLKCAELCPEVAPLTMDAWYALMGV